MPTCWRRAPYPNRAARTPPRPPARPPDAPRGRAARPAGRPLPDRQRGDRAHGALVNHQVAAHLRRGPAARARPSFARPAKPRWMRAGAAWDRVGACRGPAARPGAHRLMDNFTLGLLTAREVVAVNQDPLGVAGELVWKQGPAEARAPRCPPGASHAFSAVRCMWRTACPAPLFCALTDGLHAQDWVARTGVRVPAGGRRARGGPLQPARGLGQQVWRAQHHRLLEEHRPADRRGGARLQRARRAAACRVCPPAGCDAGACCAGDRAGLVPAERPGRVYGRVHRAGAHALGAGAQAHAEQVRAPERRAPALLACTAARRAVVCERQRACGRRIQGADDWRPWTCNRSLGLECDFNDRASSV